MTTYELLIVGLFAVVVLSLIAVAQKRRLRHFSRAAGLPVDTVNVAVTPDGKVAVTDASGTRIFGFSRAVIEAGVEANKTTAILEFDSSRARVEAVPTFCMIDPKSGMWKHLQRIEFVDGSVFDAKEFQPKDAA